MLRTICVFEENNFYRNFGRERVYKDKTRMCFVPKIGYLYNCPSLLDTIKEYALQNTNM